MRLMGSLGPNASSCGQRRLRSAWADADAQADLSLRWPHMSFCWFCHAASHITVGITPKNHYPPSRLRPQLSVL